MARLNYRSENSIYFKKPLLFWVFLKSKFQKSVYQKKAKSSWHIFLVVSRNSTTRIIINQQYLTMKLWHWIHTENFCDTKKDTETTLKNIYTGNHSDNPGLSHWNIFLCCSRTLKLHWNFLNHTEKFSALLISFVPRFLSVTLDFQCDFQCHNFIVIWNYMPLYIVSIPLNQFCS